MTFEALLDMPAESRLPSSTPILIAMEQAGERLSANELVRGEAHLTIKLGPQDIDRLEEIAAQLRDGGLSFDETDRLGLQTWEVRRRSESRIEHIFDQVAQTIYPQPFAWAGQTRLLLRIHLALLVARRGRRERAGRKGRGRCDDRGGRDDPSVRDRSDPSGATEGVHQIVAQLRPAESRRTRVALGFGTPEMTAKELQDAVTLLPCVIL